MDNRSDITSIATSTTEKPTPSGVFPYIFNAGLRKAASNVLEKRDLQGGNAVGRGTDVAFFSPTPTFVQRTV
jgi:hypothetical protein